jgi:hypothetical protein
METMNMADFKESRELIENGITISSIDGGKLVMNSEGITADCITSIDDGARIITSGTIKANEEKSKLTIKIDVDVSEAITGLKAIQREAKEATKALRELEVTKNSEPNVINITINTTNTDAKTLVETLERELAKRVRTRGV